MSHGIWILHDSQFTSGKKTKKGKPNPKLRTFETVTIILASRIDSVLGTRTLSERKEILRKLRDSGHLIVSQNPKVQRLQHVVRDHTGEKFRAYCFPVDSPEIVSYLADKIRHPAKYQR
jgi:hypothetical protein